VLLTALFIMSYLSNKTLHALNIVELYITLNVHSSPLGKFRLDARHTLPLLRMDLTRYPHLSITVSLLKVSPTPSLVQLPPRQYPDGENNNAMQEFLLRAPNVGVAPGQECELPPPNLPEPAFRLDGC